MKIYSILNMKKYIQYDIDMNQISKSSIYIKIMSICIFMFKNRKSIIDNYHLLSNRKLIISINTIDNLIILWKAVNEPNSLAMIGTSNIQTPICIVVLVISPGLLCLRLYSTINIQPVPVPTQFSRWSLENLTIMIVLEFKLSSSRL